MNAMEPSDPQSANLMTLSVYDVPLCVECPACERRVLIEGRALVPYSNVGIKDVSETRREARIEVFAPIFIRLEEELAARRTTQSAVDRARELAARRSRGVQGVNPAGTL